MKNYTRILASIDKDFLQALEAFKNDPIFVSWQTLYTDDDKKRIAHIWKNILKSFLKLKKIIKSLYWRSFFTFWSKNSFVIKYAAITTYYNMVYTLQKTFGPHEEFLRQYLDDTFEENYSTLARYMYHVRFQAVLNYPREYFLTLRDEVDPSLKWLFARPRAESHEISRKFSHDLINIWYYIRYRIALLLTWISKNGGRLMMHIKLTKRGHGFITQENLSLLLQKMQPWDILLTRQNWVATNVNIPGFWKHMAMYIWTGKFLRDTMKFSPEFDLSDDIHYIIEAIGAGVQIIPIDTLTSHNDYLWVLRAQMSEEKIQRAIAKTLNLTWREYDYSFNYYSDVNYVCSTLVTKAYLPEHQDDEWIHITLTRIATGITYPPNDIVKKYSQEYGTEQHELTFVWFIDTKSRTWENFLQTEQAFRDSYRRSKLSLFLP